MNNLNNAVEPKCTRQQVDISKITNVLNSSEMLVVSPPRQRATKTSSGPGVPEKNTNLVNRVQSANLMPTQSRKLSGSLLISGEIPANGNSRKPADDDGVQYERDSNKEDELVEEMRHLGKQQMDEMLQNKRRLEEKLELMTQENVNKKAG